MWWVKGKRHNHVNWDRRHFKPTIVELYRERYTLERAFAYPEYGVGQDPLHWMSVTDHLPFLAFGTGERSSLLSRHHGKRTQEDTTVRFRSEKDVGV